MRRDGFSLIAMSIVLTVASLVFVSFLPGREAGDLNQKTIADEQKLERVEEAMRSFMAKNGRRPCPADGSSVPGQATFGKEAGSAGVCATAPLGPDAGTGYIVGGTIPTTALALDDSYAIDAFGRRFTYVVDTRATATSTCLPLQNFPTNNGSGGLKIESTSGGTVLANTMYAYISHGPSGYGAFPEQGSTAAKRIFTGSTDTDEQVNAGADTACLSGHSDFSHCSITSDFTNVKVQKSAILPIAGDTGFDDFVWVRPDLENICCIGSAACISNGIRIDGTIANGAIGNNMAFADVNGDGIPDLLIIGYDSVNSWYDLYVVFGQSNRKYYPNPLQLNTTNLNGTTGYILTDIVNSGSNITPYFTTGDVNGDGIADIIIQAPPGNCAGGNPTTYIIFGQTDSVAAASQDITTLTNASSPAVTSLTSLAGGCNSFAVGDVNGDGINDVIASTSGYSGTNNKGYVYVYFGHPTAAAITANTYPQGPPTVWPASVDVSNLIGGTASGASYGYVQGNASTAHVGSTNPVSFTTSTSAGDLIMVALDYPSTATFSSIADTQGNSFTLATGNPLTSHLSQKTAVYYAKNVVGGADTITLAFTGSTTSDIYVTEYTGISTVTPIDVQKNKTHTGSGAASSGSATTTVPGDIIYGFCFVDSGAGCTAGSGFTARSTAGSNLVEDATSTVAGSYAATGTAGSNYTMQMLALEPVPGKFPSYGFTVEGPTNSYLAESMAVGDFNGDGYKDIAIESNVHTSDGAIIFGQPPSFSWPNPVTASSSFTAESSCVSGDSCGVWLTNLNTADFGHGPIATSDVTGDGIDDAIFGCGGCDNPAAGHTNVIYGSAASGANYWGSVHSYNNNTLTAGVDEEIVTDWTTYSGSVNGLGDSGLLAVDVNGDGKKDLIIWGGYYSNCMNIKAIYNDAWGSGTTNPWHITSITGNNGFFFNMNDTGCSVTTGDLNADGYNDIIAGEYKDSPNSISGAGSTFIVWGANGGYPNSGLFDESSTYQGKQWIRLDGSQTNGNAGSNVATADFDHDGHTDIAIAAPGETPSSNNQTGAGSVYVIWGGSTLTSKFTGGTATLNGLTGR